MPPADAGNPGLPPSGASTASYAEVGALDESLLTSGFSLAEARVLYEIARDQPTAAELAGDLRLESAAISAACSRGLRSAA